jgi:N-methylhydantoinase A
MKAVGIDVGGTFTDGVLLTERSLFRAKVPTNAKAPEESLLDVLAQLGVAPADPELLVHGTTLVTNLILERSGCVVGVITTAGFRDVLEIQRSYRRDLYDLRWQKPAPLVPRDMRLEVQERTASDGGILLEPSRDEVLEAAADLLRRGAEAIAVCLFNSYVNEHNERLIAVWLGEAHPELPVSLSSRVDPQAREYERFSTTVINAYATPAVQEYLRRIQQVVRPDVFLMHSGGGVLTPPAVAERPVRLALSGPAAGVIGALHLGAALDEGNLITFDMGGTSTDVSVIVDGSAQRASEMEVTWGIPLRGASLDIQTVGAGGGSIAHKDAGGALVVGPRSAGARPGPACYAQGGVQPTVTDANLMLGLVNPGNFLGGRMPLDPRASERVVAELGQEFGVSALEMALGIHKVVNASMAQLMRETTVKKGIDPRDFVMVSYGGAGGQHAYGVAEIVGCPEILFPRLSSTFSAHGLVQADVQTTEAQSYLQPLADVRLDALQAEFEDLEEKARAALFVADGEACRSIRRMAMRYAGQSHDVLVDVPAWGDLEELYTRFEDLHEQLYGTRLGDLAEVVSISVTVGKVRESSAAGRLALETADPGQLPPPKLREVGLFGQVVPVYDADSISPGMVVTGPALVEETDTTVVIPAGSQLSVERDGTFRLRMPTRSDDA